MNFALLWGYEYYRQGFLNINGIRLFDENVNATKNYAYFPILIEENYGKSRDELYEILKQNNIYARKYFYPLTADQACFRNKYRNEDIEKARKLSKQVLVVPLYEGIESKNIKKILDYFMEKRKLDVERI